MKKIKVKNNEIKQIKLILYFSYDDSILNLFLCVYCLYYVSNLNSYYFTYNGWTKTNQDVLKFKLLFFKFID